MPVIVYGERKAKNIGLNQKVAGLNNKLTFTNMIKLFNGEETPITPEVPETPTTPEKDISK